MSIGYRRNYVVSLCVNGTLSVSESVVVRYGPSEWWMQQQRQQQQSEEATHMTDEAGT